MSGPEMFVSVAGMVTTPATEETLAGDPPENAADMKMLGSGVVAARLFCTVHCGEGQTMPDSAALQKAMNVAHRELTKWVLTWNRDSGRLYMPSEAHKDLNGFFYSLLHGQVGALKHLARVEEMASEVAGAGIKLWPAITSFSKG
jgi:hypothetical protein